MINLAIYLKAHDFSGYNDTALGTTSVSCGYIKVLLTCPDKSFSNHQVVAGLIEDVDTYTSQGRKVNSSTKLWIHILHMLNLRCEQL